MRFVSLCDLGMLNNQLSMATAAGISTDGIVPPEMQKPLSTAGLLGRGGILSWEEGIEWMLKPSGILLFQGCPPFL